MLAGVIGNLGIGKTATLTYLAWHFSENHGKKIFANYALRNIDYSLILTVQDLDRIKYGYMFGDEMWAWADARVSSYDKYNQLISKILLSSRKRGWDMTYSSQGLYQIDKRIRKITDYILVPESFYIDPATNNAVKIVQDFLNPIDISPFLDDMAIYVDVCKPVGDNTLVKVNEFSYWLRDVVGYYDTNEEIEDIRSQAQKGIRVEGKFIDALKKRFGKDADIKHPVNSGLYQETLDVELMIDGQLYLFDVSTLHKQNVKKHVYNYIDNSNKSVKKILKLADIRDAKLFWAYKHDEAWYVVPIREEQQFKKYLNIKTLDGVLSLDDFSDAV